MTAYKYFALEDISGGNVVGATGFVTNYYCNGVAVTGATVTVSEVASGSYMAEISYEPLGELLLKVSHPTHYVAPNKGIDWTKATIYTEDDVYGKLVVASSTTALPVTPSQTFGVVNVTCKDNDAITDTIQVPARFRPLTSWTNITLQAFPEARTLTATAAPLSGTYTATVINASAGIISYAIYENVINNLVPTGVSSVKIYGDLQGDDPNGFRRSMVQFNITVNRDYNNNT